MMIYTQGTDWNLNHYLLKNSSVALKSLSAFFYVSVRILRDQLCAIF